tara:strand:+ start:535 stop:684 length:150 start_codon:yes stop_codon:yes gene_type:complete
MIFSRNKDDRRKFPRHRKSDYKSPVKIWNTKGKALFYDRNTKQNNIPKK